MKNITHQRFLNRFTTARCLACAAIVMSPLLGNTAAQACELPVSPAPEGAAVYIVSPNDGDTVSNPVKVVFGLSGMGVAPAGYDIENTGHHHLLIDMQELPQPCMPMGNPPLHFGKGQTETEVTLEPGQHTLQLVLGNYLHIPHEPMVASETITITVE